MAEPNQQRLIPWATTLFIWAVGITLVLRFFGPIMQVFLLLLGSAAIAAALRPIERWIPGRRWARGAFIGSLFWILIAGVLLLIGWQLKSPIQQQVEQWPQIEQSLNDSLSRVSQWLNMDDPLTVETVTTQAARWLLGGDGSSNRLASLADGVSGLVLAILMLVFGSVFLLAMKADELVAPLSARLPADRVTAARDSLWWLEPKLRWWLLGNLLSVVVTAVTTYIGLALIGMRFALPVALMLGLSQVVPTLGPSAATIVALLLAATQGASIFIAVAILVAIVMTLESNVMMPLIMKRAVHMSPVVSLFTVVLWARLLGPLGLLLAIPLNLVLWSFFIHFVPTRAEAARNGHRE